jgi:hypothetical protein
MRLPRCVYPEFIEGLAMTENGVIPDTDRESSLFIADGSRSYKN